MNKKIRVMIVEDSPVVSALLQHIVEEDPRFEVVAAVGSAEEAIRQLDRAAPDVISLDIRLPGMNGLDATLNIMANRPTPIVVVSASVESDDLNIAMNALKAGALTVVEKPVGVSHEAYQAMADQLRNQLAIMSQIRVVRQAKSRNLNFGSRPAGAAAPTAAATAAPGAAPSILGLVASTGGPNALSQVLGGLGRDFKLPVLLVQHITDCFLDGFVTWLGEVTPFAVKSAEDGEVPKPATVYVPPADRHLVLEHSGRLGLSSAPPIATHRPAGSVLFRSMAVAAGRRGIGVLLTGMGSDGADGLLEMRRAGAYTIAESEATAVIYGMPAAAVNLGAARESLPLTAIAPRIKELVL